MQWYFAKVANQGGRPLAPIEGILARGFRRPPTAVSTGPKEITAEEYTMKRSNRGSLGVTLVGLVATLAGFAWSFTPTPPVDLDQVVLPRVIHEGKYAYAYSTVTGSALYVVEHLTPATRKGNAVRLDNWREDKNVPDEIRPSVRDWPFKNYDRGHWARAANYGNQADRDATFNRSNCAPQLWSVNRGAWKGIEDQVHKLAETHELLVVSLPLYRANHGDIPEWLAKAVLVMEKGAAWRMVAWKVPNSDAAPHDPRKCLCTVDQLEDLAQLDLFAHLGDDVENRLESGLPASSN